MLLLLSPVNFFVANDVLGIAKAEENDHVLLLDGICISYE
jgi:hypothetical protein